MAYFAVGYYTTQWWGFMLRKRITVICQTKRNETKRKSVICEMEYANDLQNLRDELCEISTTFVNNSNASFRPQSAKVIWNVIWRCSFTVYKVQSMRVVDEWFECVTRHLLNRNCTWKVSQHVSRWNIMFAGKM